MFFLVLFLDFLEFFGWFFWVLCLFVLVLVGFFVLLFVVDFVLCFGRSIQVLLEKDKLGCSFICKCSLQILDLCIST